MVGGLVSERARPRGAATNGDFAGFSSVDVRAPLDQWTLAGPLCTRVVPGGEADVWRAAGTSSHYALVQGGRSKAVEIRVDAPTDAQLQVTAVLLPRDMPKLSLAARSYIGSDGDVILRATAREQGGRPIRLTALAWEPLTPAPDARRSGPAPGRLDAADLAERFDGLTLDQGEVKRSRPIRLPGVGAYAGPIVVKLIGVDDEGRQVAAWAEIDHDHDGGGAGGRHDRPLAGNQ